MAVDLPEQNETTVRDMRIASHASKQCNPSQTKAWKHKNCIVKGQLETLQRSIWRIMENPPAWENSGHAPELDSNHCFTPVSRAAAMPRLTQRRGPRRRRALLRWSLGVGAQWRQPHPRRPHGALGSGWRSLPCRRILVGTGRHEEVSGLAFQYGMGSVYDVLWVQKQQKPTKSVTQAERLIAVY